MPGCFQIRFWGTETGIFEVPFIPHLRGLANIEFARQHGRNTRLASYREFREFLLSDTGYPWTWEFRINLPAFDTSSSSPFSINRLIFNSIDCSVLFYHLLSSNRSFSTSTLFYCIFKISRIEFKYIFLYRVYKMVRAKLVSISEIKQIRTVCTNVLSKSYECSKIIINLFTVSLI